MNIFNHLGKYLRNGRNGHASSEEVPIDLAAELALIEHAEANRDIGLGKRIHEFRYRELDLRLDRDVTGMYRVTVNQGRERVYSFTLECPPGDYDALRAGYEEITRFLGGDRHLANLPNHEGLKGHFYGH